MRLTGSRAYARPSPTPTMPPGLVDLMEGLAKEVLKNNPENIYEFCAGHMQKLLEIRDGSPPPKKQLSLEQKIAKAQNKIRQRIKNKQFQHSKIISENSNEKHEHENEQPVLENNDQSLESGIQPVVRAETLMANEVEISHECDAIITTIEVISEEKSKLEREVTEKIEDTTQKMLNEKSAELNQEEEKESIDDNIKMKSDMNFIDESEHAVIENQEIPSKIDVDVNSKIMQQTTETQNTENENNKLDETSEITSGVEENAVNLHDEVVDKEVIEPNEVKTVPLLENIPESVGSHISDIETVQTKDDIEEKDSIEKEESVNNIDVSMNVQTKALQIKDDDSYIEVTTNDVTLSNMNVQTKTLQIKDDDSHIEVTTNDVTLSNGNTNVVEHLNDGLASYSNIEKDSVIEPEDNSMIILQSSQNKHVKEDLDDLASKTEDTVADKLCDNKTKGSIDDNPLEPTTDIETPEQPNIYKSVNGADLKDQVITVEIVDKANVDDNVINNSFHIDEHDFKNDDNVPDVDKQIIYTDNKLPEQERAYSGDIIAKASAVLQDHDPVIENNKIIENDETTENTAVSGMDLETAAITIQKVFRTFLFSKSRASTLDDTVNENSLDEDVEKKEESEYILTSPNLTKERRALGISRMDTVLQTVNEEKSLSLSDDSSLSSAATTIQAHVRGFLVRNRLASYKTASSSSLVNSDGPSTMSLDGDVNEPKKTILNIHIVPERGQFMSRDESLLTSIDLPLDNSPPSSINLHPLGYDKSERRKQLKREDAVQSISPPSNNSGKLSEEVDAVVDAPNVSVELKQDHESTHANGLDKPQEPDNESCDTTLTLSSIAETVVDAESYHNRETLSSPEHNLESDKNPETMINSSFDEMDVVTPFPTITEKTALADPDDIKPKLIHSGEFHDVVVQTQVKRNESSVVREFKNVLVYFLLWDKT